MLNPCIYCQKEGVRNINGLVLKRIAHKFVKIKTIHGDIIVCNEHLDKVNLFDKDIIQISGCGINFVNSFGRVERE